MKLQATHYNSLIPEQEIPVFVGPYRISVFVEQFLVTRALERNRNVSAPLNSFIVIIWCMIVVNIHTDIQLREEVRSQLVNTPLHEIIDYVDSYFPVGGRTSSMGNFPVRITATDAAVSAVQVIVNNGGFNIALRKCADYLNLSGVARVSSSPDILNNTRHSAITSIHVDQENIFRAPVDKTVSFMSLSMVYDPKKDDFILTLPHFTEEVEVLDDNGNVKIDNNGKIITKTNIIQVDYNKVPFYTQSTDKSGFSTARPILTSFSTFLMVNENIFDEVSHLLSLKMGYTFTGSEELNVMYQLINQSYGPVPSVKQSEPLNPVRSVPKLEQYAVTNFQQTEPEAVSPQQSFTSSPNRPNYPPLGQGRRAGNPRGQSRTNRIRTRAIPIFKDSSERMNLGAFNYEDITNIVIAVINALKFHK